MKFAGSPAQFESALQLLCERMGFTVRLTKASHDGGVDLLVDDPTPIRGGTYIVQAKRYNGAVGQPVIRDLYGTLLHQGAVKAIVITTGYFTADAIAFSKGKPIELVDGVALEKLVVQFQLQFEFFLDPQQAEELREQREFLRSRLLQLRGELHGTLSRRSVEADLALNLAMAAHPGNISFKQLAAQEVEAAIQRLDHGNYGQCESCGNPIGFARLALVPYTRLCLPCQTQQRGTVP